MEAADGKDFEKALSLIRSAYQLRPMEPQVLRAVAQICDLRSDPMGLQFWQVLITLPTATLEDRRGCLQCALDRQVWNPKLKEQLQLLLKEDPKNAKNWLLNARAFEVEGNAAQSQSSARRALALDADNEEAMLYLARQLWGAADTRKEAAELLEKLSSKPGKDGLAAALLLAQQQELAPELIDRLKDRLEKDSLGTVSHRLEALRLSMQKSPEQADALIDAAIQQYRKAGGDDLATFGTWLNGHGVPLLTMKAISWEVALKNRKLLLIYLDALGAQKKWKEIEEAVSAPGVPLEKTLVEIFKARCAQEMGENARASEHWRAAQCATIGDPEQAFYFARYARQCGRISQAESVYRTLTLNATTARAAYLEMLGMAAGEGTEAVRRVLKEMIHRWPGDGSAQNDYAYCSLLLGEEIEQSRATAADLVQKSPSLVAYQTTLALAWLRSRKPQEALAVYHGLDIDWLNAPPSFRAVAAAVYWANGRKAEARKMAGTLRKEDLKKEEQDLVKFCDD
ncbi:MAG: hypothetical protein NTZ46_12140 [Verrucomicrobia bacterium]|nr:hypothetical protein [Verrucomicrobiota bacterium]